MSKQINNPSNPYVSVVIPVYEEEATLQPLVEEIIDNLSAHQINFEIVVVDDGSKDRSFEILRNCQQEHPGTLRIARHLYNKGYGASLRTGIRVARGEIVVCMDADGQHTSADIPRMLEMIPPYDMVVGYRAESYQGSWYRNLGNRFYNWMASWLTHYKVLDLTSGYRAMRREAVNHFLTLYPTGFSASLTVTLAFLKGGYNVAYIPVHVQPRLGGQSKVKFFKDGSRFFILILRMIMLYDPLRIFLPLGGILTLLSVLAFVAGVLHERRLIFPNSTIFLLTAALLTLLLGLVSSQIVDMRIHYHGDESVTVYEDESTPSL